MTSAHRALREATADAHARVDALFEQFDLNDAAEYRAFLSAHAEALLGWESALDRAGAERIAADWPERRRGAALRADLSALGEAPQQGATPSLAQDDGSLAGAMYVLEGSRLGGKLLARRLPPGAPRSYLDSDQAPGSWRFFLEKLEALLYSEPARQNAIASALRVFASFEEAGAAWSERDPT